MSVFDDAVFYWLPGDAVTASSDTVSMTSASGSLTEGTAVTVSSRPGRTYSGSTGSRFALNPVSGTHPKDMTIMVVVRTPGTSSGAGMSYVTSTEGGEYQRVAVSASSPVATYDYRDRGAGPGGTGWPQVDESWAPANEDINVFIATADATGSVVAIELFYNGVSLGTDSEGGNASWSPDRVTVGRLDDSSPFNSSGIQVFRAYIWDRVLDSSEIAEATADPFDEGAAPDAPGNPAATALSSATIRVTWDNVADETGFRVERSPNGTTGWADVSGNLAADTVTYDDTGLDAGTTYYYRVYAFNDSGDSDPSTTVNATTTGGGNRIGGDGAIRRSPR